MDRGVRAASERITEIMYKDPAENWDMQDFDLAELKLP